MGKRLIARIWPRGGNACLPNYPLHLARARAVVRSEQSLDSQKLVVTESFSFQERPLAPCHITGDERMLYPLRGKAYSVSGGGRGTGEKLILGRLPHAKLYEFWFPAVIALRGEWTICRSNDQSTLRLVKML